MATAAATSRDCPASLSAFLFLLLSGCSPSLASSSGLGADGPAPPEDTLTATGACNADGIPAVGSLAAGAVLSEPVLTTGLASDAVAGSETRAADAVFGSETTGALMGTARTLAAPPPSPADHTHLDLPQVVSISSAGDLS